MLAFQLLLATNFADHCHLSVPMVTNRTDQVSISTNCTYWNQWSSKTTKCTAQYQWSPTVQIRYHYLPTALTGTNGHQRPQNVVLSTNGHQQYRSGINVYQLYLLEPMVIKDHKTYCSVPMVTNSTDQVSISTNCTYWNQWSSKTTKHTAQYQWSPTVQIRYQYLPTVLIGTNGHQRPQNVLLSTNGHQQYRSGINIYQLHLLEPMVIKDHKTYCSVPMVTNSTDQVSISTNCTYWNQWSSKTTKRTAPYQWSPTVQIRYQYLPTALIGTNGHQRPQNVLLCTNGHQQYRSGINIYQLHLLEPMVIKDHKTYCSVPMITNSTDQVSISTNCTYWNQWSPIKGHKWN